jgi:hypothetical protein
LSYQKLLQLNFSPVTYYAYQDGIKEFYAPWDETIANEGMQDTYNRLSIKLDFDPWRDKKYDCENR